MQIQDFHFSLSSREETQSLFRYLLLLVMQRSVATCSSVFLGKPVFPPLAALNVFVFLTSSRHFPLTARSVCFTVNGDSVLTRGSAFREVLTGCVYRAVSVCSTLQGSLISYWRELFWFMFVVNSWVYLADRRHIVIVRHQTKNAEQVCLFLWHKRGWFRPLPNRWCGHWDTSCD